jgi:hypothetical protein
MSFDPHSRRFDPRWLLPAIETYATETFKPPDASPFSSEDEWTNGPTEQDLDDALEQVASERDYVCRLCGRPRRAIDL